MVSKLVYNPQQSTDHIYNRCEFQELMPFHLGLAQPDIPVSVKGHTIPTGPPDVHQPVPHDKSPMSSSRFQRLQEFVLLVFQQETFPGRPDGLAFQHHKRGDSDLSHSHSSTDE